MRLSGGPSAATNILVVHTLLMVIQSTFDLEPEEPRKGYEKIGRVTATILVQIGSVVRALEYFSRMQSEREQTLVSPPPPPLLDLHLQFYFLINALFLLRHMPIHSSSLQFH